MVGVTLGLLPALALVPGVPEVKLTGYEAKLHMQMWSNFEVKNEQETSEEITGESLHPEGTERISENASDTESQDSTSTPAVEETCESIPETNPVVQGQTPLYTVCGVMLDESVQTYLYQRLAEAGIEWFMPYAILIAYGESSFNIYAENANGRDKGLFQYRVEYVPWMDWTNPYQQIDYFVAQMANRANSGKTVSEMISDHNMSDYGPYNQAYVDHVMSQEGTLIRVR
jgi:hypothetical protein